MRRLTALSSRQRGASLNLDWGRSVRLAFPLRRRIGALESLTNETVKAMREYLLRGRLFHIHVRRFPARTGMAGIRATHAAGLPDRAIEDLEDKDPIFHTIYDLDESIRFLARRYPGGIVSEHGGSARCGVGSTNDNGV